MKRRLITTIISLFIIITLAFTLTACGGSDSTTTTAGNGDVTTTTGNDDVTTTAKPSDGQKRIPVYQGMSIESVTAGNVVSYAPLGGNGNSENGNGNNGNHYGHYKGDYVGKDDELDKENPFPDNEENENIEEEAKDTIKVVGSVDDIYYAVPNENVYIKIHIDNPDNFEIMSFTLNEKKYSGYMFEDGSDMETIILKYNVGNTSGIVEYTIDAIKYIDGTEIKDVLIEGNKTVKAGVMTENQVSANVTDVSVGTNSLSFNVLIKDSDNLLAFSKESLKAIIYDGTVIVKTVDLKVGDNEVAFNGLKTGSVYQYAIVGNYDNLSGDGIAMRTLFIDSFTTDAVVLFDKITIGQEKIEFSYAWHTAHTNGTIAGLKLYKDGAMVKELDATSVSVDQLLTGNTYTLVAEYKNGENTENISLEFTTFNKAIPEVELTENSKTQTSVKFDIEITDEDEVGEITKIELLHGNDEPVVAETVDVREFDKLLSNNKYTVKVTYVYDLNDGNGEQTITKTVEITTEEKVAPTFVISNEDITTNTIDADYEITDVDNILSSYKVKLYKGENLISENAEKEISFTDLDYYTEYTLKITYTYDLSDGEGEQADTLTKIIKTSPYIDVTSVKIINTSAVSKGDTIYMQAILDNPLNMTVDSVDINGEIYNVTSASTKNRIFIEIVYGEQFEGGDTYLGLKMISANLDNETYFVEPMSKLSDNIFINGNIELVSVDFVNAEFEAIEWAFKTEAVYALITLNNPTGYNVDRIIGKGSNYEPLKIDDNRWYIPIEGNYFTMSSIKYSNEHLDKEYVCEFIEIGFFRVASDEIIYIETPEDLRNMNGGCYYELKNDINLEGIEWRGSEFCGVFDGKGYSIKNMTFVGSIHNQSASIGLFSTTIGGIIKNVNMENILVIASLTSDDGNRYKLTYGSILGTGNVNTIIENCTVDKDSFVSIAGTAGGIVGKIGKIINCVNNGTIGGDTNVGGIYGDYGDNNLTLAINCVNNGTISGNSYVGGIGGYYGTIKNCTNNGTINGDGYSIGGISGSGELIANCTNNGNVINTGNCTGGIAGYGGRISNCINNSEISGTKYVGGISGEAGKIVKCFNNGKISGTVCVAGICAMYSDIIDSINNGNIRGEADIFGICVMGVFTNSYTSTLYGYNDTVCTVDQLNSKEFYVETLGWSEDVWDFSELDVENGKYPILK